MHQLFQCIFKKLLIGLLLVPTGLFSQQGLTLQQYIETYKYIAISEMRQSGIPASIKLAQAILESGFGNSELAVNANNHFGIKCHGWTGRTYYYDDDEPGECFRVYTDPVQSFIDHTEFLATRPRYAFLFDLNQTDYEAWAHGLRQAGYATNPQYPQLLIRLIREHELYRFDQKALDRNYHIAEHLLRGPARIPGTAATDADEDFSPIDAGEQRETRSYNRIRYVTARQGDTPESLARELGMRLWQIRRYNNLDEGNRLVPGQRVYLQPKRRMGGERYHIAREGDTMHEISQEYGIRIENLYRRNDMTYGMEPEPDQKILLRGFEGSVIEYLMRRP